MTEAASARSWQISVPVAVMGLLFSSIGFGLVPYFSKNLTDQGLAPYAVAFYRFVFAAILLSPFLWMNRHKWRFILWGFSSGIAMGLGWTGYVAALETAPTSTLGVLYMTYPVFTVVLSWAIFRDPPTRRALVASGLIILAAILASSPAAVSPQHVPALLVSLAAPIGFGFSICVLVYKLTELTPLARLASAALGCVVGLLPLIATAAPAEVVPGDRTAWLLVIGIAFGTALIPQLIYVICSPVLGASRSAVIGSVELPTMFAVGVLAFGETISIWQGLACAIVILAIVLTRSRKTRNVATNISRR